MSTDLSSARALRSPAAMAGATRAPHSTPPPAPGSLAAFVDAHDVVRCGALFAAASAGGDGHVVRWPATVPLPRGTLELARRARAGGRPARTPLPDGGDGIDELLALPLGTSRSTPAAAAGTGGVDAARDVLVLALDGADESARRALLHAARERFGRRIGQGAAARAPRAAEAERGVNAARSARAANATARERNAVEGDASAIVRPPNGACVDAPAIAGDDVRAALERAVLDAVARHGDAPRVALAAADVAATLLGCARVSIGTAGGRRDALLAVSGESRPDARREAAARLADVVRETTGGVRRWPPTVPDDGAGSRALRALHAASGGLPSLAIERVSASGERVVAVLERPVGEPFPADADALVERALGATLALVGELRARRRGGRARAALATLARARSEPFSPRTVGVALAVVAFAVAATLPLPYRVSGRVSVEAGDRQVLVAPEAGHIRTARARAGDAVAAGELLATLDDRELALAAERWDGERAKNRAEQSRALATHDRVELARLRADAVRLDAELALVATRRERGEIRAPFAGVVLSGDPTRTLGAAVEAGDVLFEIGAGERSLLVELDERDVALVGDGARARVRMAAAPRDVLEARLAPIVPVAVVEDGREVFRVPATLVGTDVAALSPGMRGVARIDAGRRTLLDAWTRRLRETALLFGWRLGLVR